MGKNNPFFSIQVAVYNVGKYIDDCLNSILSQSEQDFEIILVDDCSQDNSGKICDEYAKKFPDKIVSIHNNENLGLLLTRRVAYRVARGQWIISVDADDLLADDALETIKNAIKNNDCDLVLYNLTCFKQDGTKEDFYLNLEPDLIYSAEKKIQVYFQVYKNHYINSMCTKAVKKNVLDLDFDYTKTGKISVGEDKFQTYPILDRAKKILYLNKSLYIYVKRENSITTNIAQNWYEQKKILWARDDFYRRKWQLGKEIDLQVYLGRIKEIIGCLSYLLENISKCEWLNFAKEIGENDFLKTAYDNIKLKGRYKVYCKLLTRGKLMFLRFLLKQENILLKFLRKK